MRELCKNFIQNRTLELPCTKRTHMNTNSRKQVASKEFTIALAVSFGSRYNEFFVAKVFNSPSVFLWKVRGIRSSCFNAAPVTGCFPNFLIYGIMLLHSEARNKKIPPNLVSYCTNKLFKGAPPSHLH
jgi:hypothetical protein